MDEFKLDDLKMDDFIEVSAIVDALDTQGVVVGDILIGARSRS